MGKPIKISADFSGLAALETWIEEFGKEARTMSRDIGSDPEIAMAMTGFLRRRMNHVLGNHRFGRFMADRTMLDIKPTNRGFTISIYGLSEQEAEDLGIEEAKVSDSGKDYNLWEFYEFHGGNYVPPGDEKSKKAIAKDTGGVLAIRTTSGDKKIPDSRKGLIKDVVAQIRPEMEARLGKLIAKKMERKVLQMMVEASKKKPKSNPKLTSPGTKRTSVRGLSPQIQGQLRKVDAEYYSELQRLGGKEVVPSSGGSLRIRGEGGRFVAFAPIRGVRLRT